MVPYRVAVVTSKSCNLLNVGDHVLWLDGHVVKRVGIAAARDYPEDGFSMYDIETGSARIEYVHRAHLFLLSEREEICSQIKQNIKNAQTWLEVLEDEDFEIPEELGLIW